MKLNLGTLTELKDHLLNEALRTATTYDVTIQALGLGVAARLEKHCNRLFLRQTGDTFETTSDRQHVCLPRFPVEQVTKVELRDDLVIGYAVQTYSDIVQDDSLDKGLLYFGVDQGTHLSRLRFTYDGGFWFPDDNEDLSDQPAGSYLRPDDLLLAWLLQCEWVWANRDKLGINLSENTESKKLFTLGTLDLVPEVKAIADAYVRFSAS